MSTALAPLIGNEMDDSMMQEDHHLDVSIAIDVDSPKHHDIAPQPMVFADPSSSVAGGFWARGAPAIAFGDPLVDVEFTEETEEDRMMNAAEVEMSMAHPDGEDYEFEMAYETALSGETFEIEDTVVHDAEVIDVAHVHQPHVELEFMPLTQPLTPGQAGQQEETKASSVTDAGPPAEVTRPESEAAAPALEVAGEIAAVVVPDTHGKETDLEPVTATTALPDNEETPSHSKETEEADIRAPDPTLTSNTELRPTEDVAHAEVSSANVGEVKDQEEHPTEEATEQEDSREEVVAPDEAAAVTVADVYAAETYEEPDVDGRILAKVPPIIITTSWGSPPTSTVLALFERPDEPLAASSSTQVSDTTPVLLEQHRYLFIEPVTTFFTHLRTELLQTQPAVIPPNEFEYKELQLVARDLQLVLTEDNIYSREITLFDLQSMHRSCRLPGYLHLDISLQPRFIDRYRAIRQAIAAFGRSDTDVPEEHEGIKESDNVDGRGAQEQWATHHGEWRQPAEGETEERAGELDGEEPPLPPDDEAASSWSEEQDEVALVEDAPALPTGDDDEREWEEVNEHDEAGEAEFVHEDEYIPPGSELGIPEALDGEEGYDHDEYTTEQAEYAADHDNTQKVDHHQVDDAFGIDAGTHGADSTVTLASAVFPENAHPRISEATEDAEGTEEDTTNEVGVYGVDAEEWDDDDYADDTLDPGQPLEEAPGGADDTTDSGATDGLELPAARHLEGELSPKNDADKSKDSTPVRKRSFNEVEDEPEGETTRSPNLKKPRLS